MDVKQLNRLLIDRFPELEKEYQEEVDWQEGDETGSHVVYGDVFTPYIEKIIIQQKNLEIQKAFAFIEEILARNEKYSDEVIMLSVLERLMLNKEQFQSCKKYLGKHTEQIIKEMQYLQKCGKTGSQPIKLCLTIGKKSVIPKQLI
ncbi:MAG: hypothetical protein K2N15_03280 [Lachnospiraceae bacterium]|nr:hypothetical protein [Lachnospiraceae bacterium]